MDKKSFMEALQKVQVLRENKTTDKATKNVGKVNRTFKYSSTNISRVLDIAGMKAAHDKKDVVGQSNDYDDVEALLNAKAETAIGEFITELEESFKATKD